MESLVLPGVTWFRGFSSELYWRPLKVVGAGWRRMFSRTRWDIVTDSYCVIVVSVLVPEETLFSSEENKCFMLLQSSTTQRQQGEKGLEQLPLCHIPCLKVGPVPSSSKQHVFVWEEAKVGRLSAGRKFTNLSCCKSAKTKSVQPMELRKQSTSVQSL